MLDAKAPPFLYSYTYILYVMLCNAFCVWQRGTKDDASLIPFPPQGRCLPLAHALNFLSILFTLKNQEAKLEEFDFKFLDQSPTCSSSLHNHLL